MCSGCNTQVTASLFGVGQSLYSLLENIKLTNVNQDLRYQRMQILYRPNTNKFYLISKNSQNYPDLMIPGQERISKLTLQVLPSLVTKEANLALIKNQFKLLKENLIKYYLKRLYLKKDQSKDKKVLVQNEVIETLTARLEFKQLGLDSFKSDFTFVFSANQLFVYYVTYEIWVVFDLKKYTPQNDSLFLKAYNCQDEQTLQYENRIYVLGGNLNDQTQSDDFIQISFKTNPLITKQVAKIQKLPQLPVKAKNLSGLAYKGDVYIFGGDYKILNDTVFKEGPWNIAKVFRQKQWQNIGNGELQYTRYFGSQLMVNHPKHGDIFVLFGGITTKSAGQRVQYSAPQTKITGFQLQKQAFMSKKNVSFQLIKDIDIKMIECHKNILNSQVICIPHTERSSILLSGEFLMDNMRECIKQLKNFPNPNYRIYEFEWVSGTVKESRYFQGQTFAYSLYDKALTLPSIQDREGCQSNGTYFALQIIPSELKRLKGQDQQDLEGKYVDQNPQIHLIGASVFQGESNPFIFFFYKKKNKQIASVSLWRPQENSIAIYDQVQRTLQLKEIFIKVFP